MNPTSPAATVLDEVATWAGMTTQPTPRGATAIVFEGYERGHVHADRSTLDLPLAADRRTQVLEAGRAKEWSSNWVTKQLAIVSTFPAGERATGRSAYSPPWRASARPPGCCSAALSTSTSPGAVCSWSTSPSPRSRRGRSGTSGERTRVSTARKIASRTAEGASSPSVRAVSQPTWFPFTIAYTAAMREAVTVAAAARSSRCVRRRVSWHARWFD
jgi:Luciferase